MVKELSLHIVSVTGENRPLACHREFIGVAHCGISNFQCHISTNWTAHHVHSLSNGHADHIRAINGASA